MLLRRIIRLAVGFCVALGIVVGVWIAYSRAAYGIWNPLAQPSRIDYCDRRYYPGSPGLHMTHAQMEADGNGFGSPPVRQVGISPDGAAIYAKPLSESSRHESASGPALPCAMVVYLKVGPDDYVAYILSGGP